MKLWHVYNWGRSGTVWEASLGWRRDCREWAKASLKGEICRLYTLVISLRILAGNDEEVMFLQDEKKQQKAMNSFYEKAAKKNERKIRLRNNAFTSFSFLNSYFIFMSVTLFSNRKLLLEQILIRFWKTFARTIYPIFCISFIVLFWILGMIVYNKES